MFIYSSVFINSVKKHHPNKTTTLPGSLFKKLFPSYFREIETLTKASPSFKTFFTCCLKKMESSVILCRVYNNSIYNDKPNLNVSHVSSNINTIFKEFDVSN